MNEEAVESAIQEKGLTAPRVTPKDLDAVVLTTQYHVFPGSCLTVCCITMRNGFTTTGVSACASPENFNKELGEQIAFKNAREAMWPLLGYALRERLHEAQ